MYREAAAAAPAPPSHGSAPAARETDALEAEALRRLTLAVMTADAADGVPDAHAAVTGGTPSGVPPPSGIGG